MCNTFRSVCRMYGVVSLLDLDMQTMRALFRQSAESNSSKQISNVFVVPGHVFISTNDRSKPQGDHYLVGVSSLMQSSREFLLCHHHLNAKISLALNLLRSTITCV